MLLVYLSRFFGFDRIEINLLFFFLHQMGRNCYKNNELNGVFLSILNGVAVHLINFVSTRGGGQGHALSEFSNEFFKPFHYS